MKAYSNRAFELKTKSRYIIPSALLVIITLLGAQCGTVQSTDPGYGIAMRIYPKGIPIMEDSSSGAGGSPDFLLLDSQSVEGRLYVLHALRLKTGSPDLVHKVIFSSLSIGSTAAISLDLTGHLDTYLEIPGHFQDVAGRINLPFSGKDRILHVNIWSLISGSGHISSASDLFIIGTGNSLSIMTTFANTSNFGKTNVGNGSGWDTEIYCKLSHSGSIKIPRFNPC